MIGKRSQQQLWAKRIANAHLAAASPFAAWPRPEDRFVLKMKASKRDVLVRCFDAIRTKLGEEDA
jgi:hypothetical protein